MYGAQDPGNWQSFKTRQDIQSLPLMEQKSKFIQEQVNFDNAMAAFSAQAHVGGIQYNPILSIAFDGSQLNAISGFTSGLEVTYTHDVTVTGIPSIIVPNGLQGGGSGAAISYTFDSAISSKVLFFTYTQAASANGTGLVAANVLTLDNELAAGITGQPTTPVDNTYVTETLTWATGTGGVGGVDITATIVVAGNTVTSVIATAATGVYQPGNTLTLAGTNLGGTGNLVVTLLDADFTGDILNLAGGDRYIALNGGSINSVGGRPARDVFAVSGINDTAIAS